MTQPPKTDALIDIRRQLVRAARAKHLRTHEWTRDIPTDWNPTSVRNPETGLVFTEVSAWDFVANLIEMGHPLQEVELDKPPCATGYVMLVPLEPGKPDLYIKVHPYGGGRVYGRSFHYSTR
jgi:hypothetical protein